MMKPQRSLLFTGLGAFAKMAAVKPNLENRVLGSVPNQKPVRKSLGFTVGYVTAGRCTPGTPQPWWLDTKALS